MRTSEEVKEIFKKRGVSVAGWAKRHGYSESLVYGVLSGRRRAVRGESHKIATALGMKPGDGRGYEGIDEELKIEQGGDANE